MTPNNNVFGCLCRTGIRLVASGKAVWSIYLIRGTADPIRRLEKRILQGLGRQALIYIGTICGRIGSTASDAEAGWGWTGCAGRTTLLKQQRLSLRKELVSRV